MNLFILNQYKITHKIMVRVLTRLYCVKANDLTLINFSKFSKSFYKELKNEVLFLKLNIFFS